MQTNAQSVLSPRDKQRLRSKLYRRKSNIMTFLGEERDLNICMLMGEVNVLQDVQVLSEKRANEIREELLSVLGGYLVYRHMPAEETLNEN